MSIPRTVARKRATTLPRIHGRKATGTENVSPAAMRTGNAGSTAVMPVPAVSIKSMAVISTSTTPLLTNGTLSVAVVASR